MHAAQTYAPPVSGTSVRLPGGLILDDGRLLDQAELRPLTGAAEEWLADHADAPSAVAVSWLLNDCLVRIGDMPASPELVGRLLVGDRDFLMLQLRRLAFGERILAVIVCPACAKKMDVDFLVDDVPVTRRPPQTVIYTLELAGRMVRFRLPMGADQEAVLGLEIEQATEALLARCLIDDGGQPLTPVEKTSVVEAMEQNAPQVDLELELTCPECGHGFTAPFDTTLFFLREMRVNGDQLLREVHLLAFYYHWREADILSMTRARRRKYLELLSDSLRSAER